MLIYLLDFMRYKWENYKIKIFLSHSLIARPQRAFQEPLFVLELRYLNLLGVYLGNISPSFFYPINAASACTVCCC